MVRVEKRIRLLRWLGDVPRDGACLRPYHDHLGLGEGGAEVDNGRDWNGRLWVGEEGKEREKC